MKRLIYFTMMIALIAAGAACEGPEGPEGEPGPQGAPGPQGPPGPAGTSQTGTVLDISQWNFNAENEYQAGISFEDYGLEVAENDVVLVYILWNFIEEEEMPIWKPLPSMIMFEEGLFKYDFIYSFGFVSVFLEAEFDLVELGTSWKEQQIFRIVVLPGEALNGRTTGSSLELESQEYKEVIKTFKIDDSNVPKYELR